MGKRYSQRQLKQAIEEAVAPLRARITEQERGIAELERENARLRQENERLRKDSSTSSKPPSSDIVKPEKNPPKARARAEASVGVALSPDTKSTNARCLAPMK